MSYGALSLTARLSLSLISSFIVSTSFADQAAYPRSPEPSMTPGSVCESPTEYRYPERIAYCKRNVETQLKRDIIREYDATFGYSIGSMDRQAFKIDHYIPLCMGGSNERSNLWPQHKTVYEKTDLLEQRLCEKMAQGSLKQADAIDKIKYAKNHLNEIDDVLNQVNQL